VIRHCALGAAVVLALAATLVAAPARADQDPVTRWLAHHGGSPARWFDVLVHVQRVALQRQV